MSIMNDETRNLMFSAKSESWDTPAELVSDLETVIEFDIDVAAAKANVCDRYITKERDALAPDRCWAVREGGSGQKTRAWCNPPYGRDLGRWLAKAKQQNEINGVSTMFLIPARTDTRWFHDFWDVFDHVVFIKGRLKFGSNASWIVRYSQTFETQGSMKKLNAVIRKIGGGLLTQQTRLSVYRHWKVINALKKLPFGYEEWETSYVLKKDSAAFPSMFATIGRFDTNEVEKIASYGVLAKTSLVATE